MPSFRINIKLMWNRPLSNYFIILSGIDNILSRYYTRHKPSITLFVSRRGQNKNKKCQVFAIHLVFCEHQFASYLVFTILKIDPLSGGNG